MENNIKVIDERIKNEIDKDHPNLNVGLRELWITRELVKLFLKNEITMEDLKKHENIDYITYFIAGLVLINSLEVASISHRPSPEWGNYMRVDNLEELRDSIYDIYAKACSKKRIDTNNKEIAVNRCIEVIKNEDLSDFEDNFRLKCAIKTGEFEQYIKIY